MLQGAAVAAAMTDEGGESTDLLSDQEAEDFFGIEVSQASIESLKIAQQRAARLAQEVAADLAKDALASPGAGSRRNRGVSLSWESGQAKQAYSPVAAMSPEQVGFEMTASVSVRIDSQQGGSSVKAPRSCFKKKVKANMPDAEPGCRAQWNTALCHYEGSDEQEGEESTSVEAAPPDEHRSVPRLNLQQKRALYSNRPDLHINPDWMHRYQAEMRANNNSANTFWATMSVLCIILTMFGIVGLSLFLRGDADEILQKMGVGHKDQPGESHPAASPTHATP
jgi:hypothetical protein